MALDVDSPSSGPSAVDAREQAYRREVLRLTGDDTEESLERRIRSAAAAVGLDMDATLRPLDRRSTQSARTALTDDLSRRSESIDSQSTSLTSSYYSDASRDAWRLVTDRARARAAALTRESDPVFAHASLGSSLSFSRPLTPAASSSSLRLRLSSPSTESFSKPASRRRVNGVGILLGRAESAFLRADRCPHCRLNNIAGHQRLIHKLPCGHRLCTDGLRELVADGLDGEEAQMPTCCGVELHPTLVQHVVKKSRHDSMLEKPEGWDADSFTAVSLPRGRRDSSSHLAPEVAYEEDRTPTFEAPHDPLSPILPKELECVQHRADLKQLRDQQFEVRARFLAWADAQHAVLQQQHELLRAAMRSRHTAATEALDEQHTVAMREAEDKQVMAEADLRETQEQETRDKATALRYMEAYCAGTYSTTGEPHGRPVTDQDHAELAKALRVHATMGVRHESAINRLRSGQSGRMRARVRRRDMELQALRREQLAEERAADRTAGDEMHEFGESVERKRTRLRQRWEMQMAIFARNIEIEPAHGLTELPADDVDFSYLQRARGYAGSSPLLSSASPVLPGVPPHAAFRAYAHAL